jgi:hypothetical protein
MTDNYPNIFGYLLPYEGKLSQKREAKKGMIPWWCLHWPRYPELFSGEKIILRQTADCIRATYDVDNFFVLNSVLVLKLLDESDFHYYFVLAVLNSKLEKYVYRNLTQEAGRAFAEVKPKNIRKLQIPICNMTVQLPVIDMVSKMLEEKRMNPHVDISKIEHEIDKLIYKIYKLSEEEVSIIEKGV